MLKFPTKTSVEPRRAVGRAMAPRPRVALRVAVASLVLAATAFACGPFFHAWLLSGNATFALSAPVVNFARELSAWKHAPTSKHRHVEPANSHAGQTALADLADLAEALERSGLAAEQRGMLLEAGRRQRAALDEHATAQTAWRRKAAEGEPAGPQPEWRRPPVPGLPAEFALYHAGAVAYHAERGDEARVAWESLLQLPEAERRYRSTWAAFMLGRRALQGNPRHPDEARRWYQHVRELATAGFHDRLGLAAASLGYEAQLAMGTHDHARAIPLYLEQFSAGETNTSVQSLRLAAKHAVAGGVEPLRALARLPEPRRVITAWLISREPRVNWSGPENVDPDTVRWLEAVEAADVREVELSEQLALAAYQSGEFLLTRRWLQHAPADSLAARWLRAKLLLWDGDFAGAAKLHSAILREFPGVFEPAPHAFITGLTNAPGLFGRLQVEWLGGERENGSAVRLLAGEAGLFRLQRREFAEAMDVLLRAGFWMDGAYLAERVLTLDELKLHVERCWPAPVKTPERAEQIIWGPGANPDAVARELRYLLARRLAREQRGAEAVGYFPAEQRGDFLKLREAQRLGHDLTRPKVERKESLVTAARLLRHQGMELIGTETGPDWAVHGGQFDIGVTPESRKVAAFDGEEEFPVPGATAEELQRAARHRPRPEARFHYRHLAAEVAWEAAQLMPDQSPELARWLCEAGGWLKRTSPDEADRFYKALVRRCGRTDIGRAADQLRWFPPLDEQGGLAKSAAGKK